MAESKPAAKETPPPTVSDVLQKADISLDGYDDIFSDFDYSPFGKRLLSEDFLSELRRRYSYTWKGDPIVNFTLPKARRSEKTESLIKKRIKDHFKSRVKEIERKTREKIRNGAVRVSIGIVLSFALFVVPELETVPALTIFSVLIWYSTWSGLESILQASSTFKKRRAFAERFMKAEYNFASEEDVVKSIEEAQAAQKEAQKDAQKEAQKEPQKEPDKPTPGDQKSPKSS
ncbi:MAG: hypothetical protein AB1295_03695 [Candidatus Micrarchaeota archaeon]